MTKATTLKAGKLIEVEKPKLQRRAMINQTDDMSILPTYEILRRVYMRHRTGIWQFLFIISWAGIIYSRFH